MQPTKQYFPALDVLRFFAAFWVMLFHYFLFYSGDLHFYRYGNLGVQLFFIISGFVIAESIQGKSLKEFAYGRFVRLFPIFWIACTITYLFTLWAGSGIRFSTYLINMTMIGYNAVKDQAVDAVYWSLTVELFFYAFIAIFVAMFTFKKIRWFYGAWLAVATLAFIFGVSNHAIAKLLLIRHASYFIFGGILFLVVESYLQKRKQKIIDIALLIYTAILSVVVLPISTPPYFVPHPKDGFFVALIISLYFILVPILIVSFRNPSKKVAHYTLLLGGLTYPLYLVHQRIGLILIDFAKGSVSTFEAYLYAFTIVFLGTYGLYKLDKYIRGHLKRFAPKSTLIAREKLLN